MIRQFLAPALVSFAAMAAPAVAQDETEGAPAIAQDETRSWLPTLMTETPEEGFDLAVRMARKAVTTTQTDTEVLHGLRPNYSRDPDSLINVSGVVARYFAVIAEANDYWRD